MRSRLGRVALAVVVVTGGVGGLVASGSSQAAPPAPATASRFSLTIDGFEIASFSELAGITESVEPTEYLASDDKGVVLNKLPGKLKPPTVTLKRSVTGSLDLWAWHEAVRRGDLAGARKSCSLTFYDDTGKPMVRYWLEKAWPSSIELAPVAAGKSTTLVETVTLVAEYLQRVAP